MTNDTSPVIDFYPVNFDLDLNGKLQEWEAVVLIPFIEEVCSTVTLKCTLAKEVTYCCMELL